MANHSEMFENVAADLAECLNVLKVEGLGSVDSVSADLLMEVAARYSEVLGALKLRARKSAVQIVIEADE